MNPVNYRERYKRILRQNQISKEDVKQFKEAVKHFEIMYPEWDKMQLS